MSLNRITDDDLILVTGASGYIATHIVKKLLEKGYRVRGTVRSLRDEKKVGPLRQLAQNSRFELELVEADLMNEDSWSNAVKGCTYVLHTASPFPLKQPSNEDELIRPAVNGTLFVFRACVQEGSRVKRVVLTSSIAAIAGNTYKNGYTYSEKDWPDVQGLEPYLKSKTLAEKAAWDFVRDREKNGLPCFELSVINPGLVMGPLLHDSDSTSLEIVKRIMENAMPMIPNVCIAVCDVRDVADAHIKAMTVPGAVNNRHLISSTRDGSSSVDWARMLNDEFAPKNYKIPTKRAPNCIIRIGSIFDKSMKQLIPMLDNSSKFDNSRLVNVLGVQPIDVKRTIIDSAYGLIDRKFIPKKF